MLVNHDAEGDTFAEYTFILRGMSCPDCEAAVERSIIAIHGVYSVRADAMHEQLMCEYDATVLDDATLVTRIRESGYLLVMP
ncbi:MAG: cation transporter [Candidatus Kapabacteria bacterium]|nr:cation transporter [Candidatus Kapabacteria bacterium]